MPRKPNYKFERLARERSKAEKKEQRRQAKADKKENKSLGSLEPGSEPTVEKQD